MKNMVSRLYVILAVMIIACLVITPFAYGEKNIKTGWVDEKGGRFLYANNGKKVTGWYQEGNDWYYLAYKGMVTDDWVRLDTGFYHAGADGRIDEGWQKYKGIWYVLRKVNVGTAEYPKEVLRWFYVDGSEEMPFGKREIAGKTYDVTNKKAAFTGWSQYSGGKLYFNEDGTSDVGWRKINGDVMYFDLAGRTVKGQRYISGAYYTFTWKGILNSEEPKGDFAVADSEGYNAGQDIYAASGDPVVPENTAQQEQEDWSWYFEAIAQEEQGDQTPWIIGNSDTPEIPGVNNTNPEPVIPENPAPAPAPANTTASEPAASNPSSNETASTTASATTPASTTENKPAATATEEFTYSYVTEKQDIPYQTVYIDAPNWPKGETAVAQEGQNGQKEITYQIKKDKNGKEVSRTVSSEKVIKQVKNKEIYRGTFVSEVTYTVVDLQGFSGLDSDKRTSEMDAACTDWAMQMAENNNVQHSGQGHGESVGAWGSIDQVINGREYTVISTQDGQTYSGNVSLESHGGGLLANGDSWGAGCVVRSETQPDGTTVDTYFAVARSELDDQDSGNEDGN